MTYMNKAVVLGAGIAGLITARMLSDHYNDVCIVERDELPNEPANRQGTPQSFHPHRVLPRGSIILERYFPGYNDELLAHGAHSSQQETVVFGNKYGKLTNKADIPTSAMNPASSSRALLEWVLRKRVNSIDNIHFLTNTEVTGLITSEDNQTITGIYTKERNKEKREGNLSTDMVIDTTGRSSKLVKWLSSLGFTVPEPEVLKVSLGYSTRYYTIPIHVEDQWKSVISEANPVEGISTGMLMRIENNIAGLLLFSAGGGHYPTTNSEEFQKEINDVIASDEMVEMVNQLEPLKEPRGYRTPESIRQHFEKMENWPSGLLVLGDAFCSFDPIHGQGMTVAAIEAETVGYILEEQKKNPQPQFEREVLHRMQQAIEPAWWLSSIADLRWNGVEHVGDNPLQGVIFAQKYIDLYTKQAMRLANEDKDNKLFLSQFMMNALILPPSEYFNASVLSRILNDNGSIEELELRAALGVEDQTMFQQKIDELIPSFDSAFDERLKELLTSFQHS